ncbi:MAG: NifB/NifX family molybdenum-iron cluster-binding protein [Coriobacteriia bacterium]|nr:NifB/NifX family molybdenum-iron cluster-binding protein [Coriobacteriia bacterium]MBN2841361.1 NifB/NifX family molybdenum-iron cluster-binding protein [Coriobacteriia bacterium]
MTDNGRIVLAVPSNGTGGLESERSGHFGRCDCFTVVEIEDGAIVATRVVANPPHEEGGCLRPVNLLAGEGVNALVVAGIGGRPLAGFNDAGITVYFDTQVPVVGAIAQLVAAGSVEVIDPSAVCGGH